MNYLIPPRIVRLGSGGEVHFVIVTMIVMIAMIAMITAITAMIETGTAGFVCVSRDACVP